MARKKVTQAEMQKLEAPPINKPATPLFAYVVAFAGVGIISIVVILGIRPESDIVIVIGVVGGLVTSIILSFMGYVRSAEASAQSKETYHLVNSRMTIAIDDAVKAALGEGRRQGRRGSEARTDKLERERKAREK